MSSCQYGKTGQKTENTASCLSCLSWQLAAVWNSLDAWENICEKDILHYTVRYISYRLGYVHNPHSLKEGMETWPQSDWRSGISLESRGQSPSSINKTGQWQLVCVFRHAHPAPQHGNKRRARANAHQFFAEEPRLCAPAVQQPWRQDITFPFPPSGNKGYICTFRTAGNTGFRSIPKSGMLRKPHPA